MMFGYTWQIRTSMSGISRVIRISESNAQVLNAFELGYRAEGSFVLASKEYARSV